MHKATVPAELSQHKFQCRFKSRSKRSPTVCRTTVSSAEPASTVVNTSKATPARGPAASRPAPLLPQSVPIIHSSAYLQQRQDDTFGVQPPEATAASTLPEEFKGSALEWALRRADKSLDEIEKNPPVLQKAIYDVAHGPLGNATAKGVGMAAKVTVKATVEAAKVAAPLGQWALKEGMKLAATVLTQAMQQEQRSQTTKLKITNKKVSKA